MTAVFDPRVPAVNADPYPVFAQARVRGRGETDLIRDVAYPLPIAVIGDMIGVPAADRDAFKTWSDDLATFVGRRHPSAMARLRARPELAGSAVEEMLRYDGPSGAMTRVALEDGDVDGVKIARGDRCSS